MLAAAFVPHPPALVPVLCGGPVTEFAEVRAACTAAVEAMLGAGPEVVWLVGAGPSERWYGAGDVGSLAPFGRPVTVPLSGPAGPDAGRLPLSLTVGAWLLQQAGYAGERLALAVPADAADEQLRELAGKFVGPGAILVLGDGAAMRGDDSPGTRHPADVGFDDAVAAALAAGDATALSALDPRLGAEVHSTGVAPWRLAGNCLRDVPVSAELLYYGAPFGVAYLAATWTPL